ncbi:hypothetical protein D3C85_1735500 [compost metagenome]
MLCRRMVDNDIGHQMHAAFLQLPDQFFKILHGSKGGVNLPVIGNIVTVIILWRYVNRLQPHYVDPQLLQIIKLAG